jgi:hypothetical protein
MYLRTIILKILIFIYVFTVIFFAIRFFNLLPQTKLQENINSIPWLFSAISLIFSIICGFVIQSRWHMWDELIDATREELSSFRQLHIMAHHFPQQIKQAIRLQIAKYLELVIVEIKTEYNVRTRSDQAENVLYQLEDIMFLARKKHPESGVMGFDILRSCMNYREQRLQNNAHKLPPGIKIFIISATVAIIVSSLFIGVDSLLYDYLFTLIIGLLSYGIYLVIDDLDHPYRPGDWHLKTDGYDNLLTEIRKKLA